MGTTESILEHQTSPTANGGKHHAHRPSTARRKTPKHATHTTLNGILLGMPLSGKKTLLQRLQGKNPFAQADDGAVDQDDYCTQVTVPYLAPGMTWEDRIQLHVEIPTSFQRDPPDFCVVLINPRYEWKSVRPYLLQIVEALLEHSREQPKTVRRTIVLCLLLTFRDQRETSDKYEQTLESDLQHIAQEVMHQHKSLRITTGTTSLSNCYGLNTLHHFIYESYLNKKQSELKQQLRQVQEQWSKTRKETPEPVDYQEFVRQLENPDQTARIRQQQSNDTIAPRKIMPVVAGGRDGHEEKQSRSKRHSLPRKGHPAPKAAPAAPVIPPMGTDPKQTLDDFFADDDSDDEQVAVVQRPSRNDNDEDEDDFFYDGQERVGVSEKKEMTPLISSKTKRKSGRLSPVREQEEEEDEKDMSQQTTAVSPVAASSKQPLSATVTDDSEGDGWSDDDVDISLSDAEEPASVDTIGERQQELKDASALEANKSGDGDGSGWSDDEGLELDETEKDAVDKQKGLSSKSAITNYNGSTPDSVPVENGTNRQNGIVTKSSEGDGWSDDDDDFMVGFDNEPTEPPSASSLHVLPEASSSPINKPSEELQSPTSNGDGGASAAILAAIAAAEDDARTMLSEQERVQQQALESKATKKAKKKKSKEEKAAKRERKAKKKSKQQQVVENDSF